MKPTIPIFAMTILCLSCSKYPQGVNETLKIAGDNKPELEKVLEHYSQSPGDSLKFKAACFLIDNMKWHYRKQLAVTGNAYATYMFEDSLFKATYLKEDDGTMYRYKLDEKKKRVNKFLDEVQTLGDLTLDPQFLRSDFLIKTIEVAFKNREKPWNKDIPFSDFCESILPYSFFDEPVYDIREQLNTSFETWLKSENIKSDPVTLIKEINRYVLYLNWDWEDFQETEL